MTKHPTPFLRRRALIEWLEPHGYSRAQIDQWIRDGFLPCRKFTTKKHTQKNSQPRAYYVRDEVAQKLGVVLPSSASTLPAAVAAGASPAPLL